MRVFTLIALMFCCSASYAGYECDKEDKDSELITISAATAGWAEEDFKTSPTLTSVVIKIPRTFNGIPFQGADLRSSIKPRFILPLRFVEGSFEAFESDEKSKLYYFINIVADKDYFNGQYCVAADYYEEPIKKIRIITKTLKINDVKP